jgi:hypothetical protein
LRACQFLDRATLPQAFYQAVQRPDIVRVLCAALNSAAQAQIVATDILSLIVTRYAVRRLRRKVPRAKIMLAVWGGGDQADAALDAAKADVIAVSLRKAVRICIDEARAKDITPSKELPSVSAKLNSA